MNRTGENTIDALESEVWTDFLKILTTYMLKRVERKSTNDYTGSDGTKINRRETTAEHIYSAMKLACLFLDNEPEFQSLNKEKIYELLMFHDDVEIETGDVGIAETEKRVKKRTAETLALPQLANKYPEGLRNKLILLDTEFREQKTTESLFAHAIDKLDALVHELQYPADWGPKGFTEANVREWFGSAFTYSPTFQKYFETLIIFLKENSYF